MRWRWETDLKRDEIMLWGDLRNIENLSAYISCSPFSLRTEKTWLKLPQVGVMEDRPVLENSSALGICWIKIIFYETFC